MEESDSAAVAMARAAYAAFNRGDVRSVLERCDPEIEWNVSDRLTRNSRSFRGFAEVQELFALFAESFDELHIEPLSFHDDAPRLLVPLHMRLRGRGAPDTTEFDAVHAWTLRDLRALRLDVFDDLDAARAAR